MTVFVIDVFLGTTTGADVAGGAIVDVTVMVAGDCIDTVAFDIETELDTTAAA